jgi:hypothetical protein
MKFNPPVEELESYDLIVLIEQGTEMYQQEYIDQAKAELKKRNVSDEERQHVINQYLLDHHINLHRQNELENLNKEENGKQGYTLGEMVIVVLLTPLILVGKMHYDKPLSLLWSYNYKRKFWQRVLCFFAGIGFWYLVLYYFLHN